MLENPRAGLQISLDRVRLQSDQWVQEISTMPIINMTRTEEEANRLGSNVRPYKTIAAKYQGEDAAGKRIYTDCEMTLWLYDTHVGLCIQDRERNGRDDSDWDMLVWNAEKQAPEWIEFASTRGWTYPCYGSRPDATPEVRALYEAWDERRIANERRLREERLAAMPTKGKTLRVIKGRKIPRGTVGPCFWSSVEFKYDHGYQGRVGITMPDGSRQFTNVDNVEVVVESAASDLSSIGEAVRDLYCRPAQE